LRLDFVIDGHFWFSDDPIIQKKEVLRPPDGQFGKWSQTPGRVGVTFAPEPLFILPIDADVES